MLFTDHESSPPQFADPAKTIIFAAHRASCGDLRTTGRIQRSPGAKEWLALRGYDPVFGARPLKRVIQKEVLDPLAMKVLAGQLREGDTVTVDASGGGLTFHSSLSQAPLVA